MTDDQLIAHRYLSQYRHLQHKISDCQDKIELFESAVNAAYNPLTDDNIKHTPGENPAEKKIAILVDLKIDMQKEIDKHQKICDMIMRLIVKTDDADLLMEYYVAGQTIADMAKRLKLCEMTIRRCRNKQLDTIYGIAMRNFVNLDTTY